MAELRQTMGSDEYVMWTRYYARYAQRLELAQREAAPG